MTNIKCSADDHGNCQTPDDCCLGYQPMLELSTNDVENICKWLQTLENMLDDKKQAVTDQINDPDLYTRFTDPAKVLESTIVLLQGVKKAKDGLLSRIGVP